MGNYKIRKHTPETPRDGSVCGHGMFGAVFFSANPLGVIETIRILSVQNAICFFKKRIRKTFHKRMPKTSWRRGKGGAPPRGGGTPKEGHDDVGSLFWVECNHRRYVLFKPNNPIFFVRSPHFPPMRQIDFYP